MSTGPENPYEPTQPYQPAPPPYGQPPYGQTQPGQQPAPPPHGQPQQPYQQGYPPYGYQPVVPKHPSANTSMVLGIVALAGLLFCGGLTLVLSPFAWISGARAVRDIDQAPPGTYGGRDAANAGKVMGIVGTVLLALGVLAIVAFFAIVIGVSASSSTY